MTIQVLSVNPSVFCVYPSVIFFNQSVFVSIQVSFESCQVSFDSFQVSFESIRVSFESIQVSFESTELISHMTLLSNIRLLIYVTQYWILFFYMEVSFWYDKIDLNPSITLQNWSDLSVISATFLLEDTKLHFLLSVFLNRCGWLSWSVT